MICFLTIHGQYKICKSGNPQNRNNTHPCQKWWLDCYPTLNVPTGSSKHRVRVYQQVPTKHYWFVLLYTSAHNNAHNNANAFCFNQQQMQAAVKLSLLKQSSLALVYCIGLIRNNARHAVMAQSCRPTWRQPVYDLHGLRVSLFTWTRHQPV